MHECDWPVVGMQGPSVGVNTSIIRDALHILKASASCVIENVLTLLGTKQKNLVIVKNSSRNTVQIIINYLYKY